MTSVAFLGLGVMGGGMAARLVTEGFRVSVWNRSPERVQRFRDLGAWVADSPRHAAEHADVVFSMVADDAASRSVWLGDAGAVAGARPDTVLVECSTLSPAWIEELAAHAAERGCAFVDAPVTGSKTQAAGGQLLFLAGGDAHAIARIRPVLAAMSRDVLHLGPVGSGARMKLVNNFVCGVQAAALAEAVALIERSGLDRDIAIGVLQNGAPGSPLVKAVSARMAASDYTVNFLLPLMRKDLTYASEEAARQGLTLSTADTARRLFDRAMAEWSDADFAAVVEPLRRSHTP